MLPALDSLAFPVMRDGNSDAVGAVIRGAAWQQQNVDVQAGEARVNDKLIDKIQLPSQDGVLAVKEVAAHYNGSALDTQIPGYYHPPAVLAPHMQLRAGAVNATSKRAVNSQEVNILLLHIARLGDVVSARSLSRSPRIDLNVTDDEGRTPLMFSCIGNHVEMARMLVERGALIHQADHSGR